MEGLIVLLVVAVIVGFVVAVRKKRVKPTPIQTDETPRPRDDGVTHHLD